MRRLVVCAVVLAVGALVGPEVRVRSGDRVRVLLFDISASVRPDVGKLDEFVGTYTSDLGAGERWSLWAFGKNPVMLIGSARGGAAVDIPLLPAVESHSAVGKALRTVVSLEKHPSEIVIYTDGRDTTGSRAGLDVSVPVYPVLPEDAAPVDVRVRSARAPETVSPGEPFSIEADIRVGSPSMVDLTVTRHGVELDARTVSVGASGYRFRFGDTLMQEGSHSYTVSAKLKGDVFSENDTWEVPVRVGDSAVVLVLSVFGEQSAWYRILRRAPGVTPRTVRASDLRSGAALSGCAALIVEGISAGDLTTETHRYVSSFVRGGGGLLVAPAGPAGDMSDYRETDIGKLLPVDFKDEDTRHLIIALDRSGSMARRAGSSIKIDMAKQAVLSAAGFVRSNGMLDVIAFHNETSRVFTAKGKAARDALGEALAGIRASGGTKVIPALTTAAQLFVERNAKVRSLIIISDGFASEKDVAKPAADLRSAGVKVSAVGVGDEVNTQLLSRLASETGGTWIHLSDASEMPRVVAGEAKKDMAGMFATGTFQARVASRHPIAGNVSVIPRVQGVTRCHVREGAESVLATGTGEPVLSTGRASSGKVVFLAVPLVQEYAPRWLAWNGLQALVEGAVSWVRRDPALGESIDYHIEGGELVLEVRDDAGGSGTLNAVLEGNGARTSVDLKETEPGLWAGRVGIGSPGLASIQVLGSGGGAAMSRMVSIPYAREFADIGTDEAFLSGIASLTGGKLLRMGELPALRSDGTTKRPLRPLLAGLAAALLVADVIAAWARSRRRWVAQGPARGH